MSDLAAWFLPVALLATVAVGDESADLAVKLQGNWTATAVSGGPQQGGVPELILVFDGNKVRVLDENAPSNRRHLPSTPSSHRPQSTSRPIAKRNL